MSYRARKLARISLITLNLRDHEGPAPIGNSWPNWVTRPDRWVEIEHTPNSPRVRGRELRIPNASEYLFEPLPTENPRFQPSFGQRSPRIYKARFRRSAPQLRIAY